MELLNSLGWNLASFVFVLGIMIFVHELGHHLVAKLLGIRVDVFSLGFGPRLFGFRRGDTDYRVSLIPLGGYVRMAGENYDDNLSGSPEEFLSRPKTHRLAVAIAGPAMNVLLAVVLLSVNFMVGIQVPAYLTEPAVIGHIADGSPAADAGLQIGDRVVAIEGRETPNWEEVQLTIATSPDQKVAISVARGNEVIQKIAAVAESESSGVGYIGIMPPVSTVITTVEPTGAAARASLQPGDAILKVTANDAEATKMTEILALIAARGGEALQFTIQRNKEVIVREVTPVLEGDRAKIGVSIGQLPILETKTERYGPFEAVGRSIERNYQLSSLTFRIIGKLLVGATSLKMMSGPIEIAKFSGQAASQGAMALIGFMALISLQLGIFNLFPIPILDGGVIALLLVEAVIRRDLSLQAKERIFKIGFFFLVILMSIVIFNDITKNI